MEYNKLEKAIREGKLKPPSPNLQLVRSRDVRLEIEIGRLISNGAEMNNDKLIIQINRFEEIPEIYEKITKIAEGMKNE